MIASANSSNAAAKTTHANGPPMINATIPKTATTTFAMVTITSHASPAQSLNFSHRDRSGIPASDASWIRAAADRPSASRNDFASNANTRAWSNRACAASTAASADDDAARAEDNLARASRTCSAVGSRSGFLSTPTSAAPLTAAAAAAARARAASRSSRAARPLTNAASASP